MNIHLLSNSPTRVNSGFGIVSRNLALGLQKLGHNVSVSDMQNIYNREWWNGMCIYPMNSVENATTGNEFYISELQQLTSNLKDSKAEVMIIIYPAYDNVIASNRLHELHKNVVWYYPVEGENLPSVYTKELQKVKCVVPMTKQGCKELEKNGIRNIWKNDGVNREIYHGFDDKVFKRNDVGKDNNELHYCKWSTDKYQLIQDKKVLCERGCFKCNGYKNDCQWFEEEEFVVNVFGEEYVERVSKLHSLRNDFGFECIFGFTGENNGKRKKIDRLLDSFSKLCKSGDVKSSEVLLLMHTIPISANGLNLWEYVKKYDLGKCRVMFTYGVDELGNSWSDKALNIMYNSIDVNVSCSSAEGFGLPTLESMACGKPQVAPNYSSFIEMIKDETMENDRGLLADIQGYEFLNNGMRRALVSSKSIANLMSIMVEDKSLRNKLSNNAYNWSQHYTWDNICNKFNNLIINM